MDAERARIGREVERRWREIDQAPTGPWPVRRRDGEVEEILDGNVDAFLHHRPPGSETTLAEAQLGIVTAIQRMEMWTLGARSVVDLILRTAERRRIARGGSGPLRLLEAASGAGWLQRHLWRRAQALGLDVRLEASDYNPDLVAALDARFAREGVPCAVRQADARFMPGVDNGAWDVAFMTYTLHHFSPADAALCLRELDRVSGGGLVLVDISRNRFNLAALPVLTATVGRVGGRYAVHDTIASIRRGYTAQELTVLALAVGLGGRYRIGRMPTWHPQRFVANAIWPA